MQTLHYSIFINAPREKVWKTILEDATYREWTRVFNPAGESHYEGSWEEGSTIKFVGPDPKTGKLGGMLSRIAENRPHEFISIEHVGIIHDGFEDTTSEEAKKWTPAHENYTFNEKNGGTELVVDLDSDEENAKMFDDMWPKGLQKLKELSEA